MNTKQSIEIWEEYAKAILESTTIDAEEPEEIRLERIARLEADPEEWFKYYFPLYCSAPPAAFHIKAAQRVISKPEHYEVRMWSRELAKSTRTMMEVFYLMLVGHPLKEGRMKKRYALIVSNSLDNATRLLTPYKINFENNRRIIQDYGIQVNAGKWQAAEFTTQKGASFRALGVGQSPRGTRNEEVRPDVLLFDDVDTDADCLNPDIVAKKWRWIEEAAIGTRSVSEPTTIIFCGNRIAVNCCIQKAVAFADHHDVINIRWEDGTSSWPEKNSEVDIDRVLTQKSSIAAQKEYFNNPVTEGAVFTKMSYKPTLAIKDYEYLVCYTDPSYTDTNDYKATVLVGKWKQEYHIIKCFVEQTTTAGMLEWHMSISQIVRGKYCHYYMESVFMQDVIRKEVSDMLRERTTQVKLNADKRKKPSKFMRIEALLEPLNRNGYLYLNEAEKYNPHMVRLVDQFTTLSPNSTGHDDAPDAVEGAIWKLYEKAGISHGNGIAFYGNKCRNNRW